MDHSGCTWGDDHGIHDHVSDTGGSGTHDPGIQCNRGKGGGAS